MRCAIVRIRAISASTMRWPGSSGSSPARAILTNLHADLDYDELRAKLPPHVEPAFDGLHHRAVAYEALSRANTASDSDQFIMHGPIFSYLRRRYGSMPGTAGSKVTTIMFHHASLNCSIIAPMIFLPIA